MKATDRDELIIRTHEGVSNIWRILEQLEQHQAEQNGYIRENLESTIKNTAFRKTSRWILGLLFTAIIALTIVVVN